MITLRTFVFVGFMSASVTTMVYASSVAPKVDPILGTRLIRLMQDASREKQSGPTFIELLVANKQYDHKKILSGSSLRYVHEALALHPDIEMPSADIMVCVFTYARESSVDRLYPFKMYNRTVQHRNARLREERYPLLNLGRIERSIALSEASPQQREPQSVSPKSERKD